MSKIDPFSFPYVLFGDKHNLPSTSGIYYVLNRFKNEIAYIGQSKNIRSRWVGHHRNWDFKMIDSIYKDGRIVIAWELCLENLLLETERRRINELQPIINGIKLDETPQHLEQEDQWQDLPDYYRYIVKDVTDGNLPLTASPEDLEYIRRKPYLLELINYRHPLTKQIIPRYRYFEQDCLFFFSANIDKDPSFEKYAVDIYQLLRDDLRFVLLYSIRSLEISYQIEARSYISKGDALYGIALILGHLIDADIKATSEIVVKVDYRESFIQALNGDGLQQTVITLLRPVYKRTLRGNWSFIKEICIEDLESVFFPRFIDQQSVTD